VRLLEKHTRKRRDRRQRRKAKVKAAKATEAPRSSGGSGDSRKHATIVTADAATQTEAHDPAVARGSGPRLVEASTQTEELEGSPSEELGPHVECESDMVAEDLGSTQRKRARSASPPPRGAACGESVTETLHNALVAVGVETGAASGVVDAEQASTNSPAEVKRARVEGAEEQHCGSVSEEQCSGSSPGADGRCPMQAEAGDQSQENNNIDPCQRPASATGGESTRSPAELEKRRLKKQRNKHNRKARQQLLRASGGEHHASVEENCSAASHTPHPTDAAPVPFDASCVPFRSRSDWKLESYLQYVAEGMTQARFCDAGVCLQEHGMTDEVTDAYDDYYLAQLDELNAKFSIVPSVPCH